MLVDFCDMIIFFPSNDIVTYLDSWYDIIECDLLNSCLSNLSLSVLCDEVESTIPCESYIEDDRMQEREQVKKKRDLFPIYDKSDDYDEKSSINTMELAKQRNEIKEYFFEIYELHKDNESVEGEQLHRQVQERAKVLGVKIIYTGEKVWESHISELMDIILLDALSN